MGNESPHIRADAFVHERQRQVERFNELGANFRYQFAQLAATSDGHEAPEWRRFAAGLLPALYPVPPLEFLQLEPLRAQTVYSGPQTILREVQTYVRAHFAETFAALAAQDAPGGPLLLDAGETTSSENRLWHMHHLARLESVCGEAFSGFKTIVVWGAGYGEMPRLLRRRYPGAAIVVYETPALAALTWLYLSAVDPAARVSLVAQETPAFEPGATIVAPFAVAAAPDSRACDAFVATAGLRETAGTGAGIARLWLAAARHVLATFDPQTRWPQAGAFAAEASGLPGSTLHVAGLTPFDRANIR